MLAYHLNESTGIVELRPRGRLEARDFASLALTVDAARRRLAPNLG